MTPLLLAAALAAPPGFVEVKEAQGCALFKGPTEADGVTPMHAECHWPEVDVAHLQSKLGDYAAYDELIFAITTSEPRRTEGGRTLVHQVQETWGISTREVLVWMSTTPVEGGVRYTWETAGSEPLEVPDGRVRSPRNEGFWEVGPHPEGGARVVHRVAYDPGGSVPDWVVRRAQVGGMLDVMKDVRAAGVP